MIGVMIPSVFAEISYPTISQRLGELPTYCIIDPVNFSTAERIKYTSIAEKGIQEWDKALQSSVIDNPSNWKITSKIISSSEQMTDCTIILSFHETVEQLDNGIDVRTIGLFKPMTQSIEIAIQDLQIDQIFNVILHEIGHSFGLGHYVSDNPETNEGWYSGLVSSPSIMIPVLTTDVMSIENVDVQKVLSIYGSDGFYAFSPQSPPAPPQSPELPSPPIKPIIPLEPIIPILPFDSIQILDTEILLKSYETKYSKIVGQIKESVYKKGHPVHLTIIKPDYTFDTLKITTTKMGYFETTLIFDKHSPVGQYTVEASYIGHRDDSMDFTFIADFKQSSSPKIEEKTVTEIEIEDEVVQLETEQEDEVVQLETEQEDKIVQLETEQNDGGCLIATATYGSELAPQVQQLRELRDNQLLQTESGTAFMNTFNDIYYSFSPTIADMERENPYFKEAVKLTITPMISSLSLMENAETESEVLGIGISVIALNLGMYLGVPAIVVIGIKRKF